MNDHIQLSEAKTARLHELLAALAEEPPKTLSADILARVRRERAAARARKRRAWIASLSAAAAAVVLLPAITLGGPKWQRSDSLYASDAVHGMAAPTEAAADTTASETKAAEETLFSVTAGNQNNILYSNSSSGALPDDQGGEDASASSPDTGAPVSQPDSTPARVENQAPAESAAAESAAAESAAAESAPETGAAPQTTAPTLTAAPNYVLSKEPGAADGSGAPQTTVFSAGASAVKEAPHEEPLLQLIRTLVGSDALNEWLTAYTGTDDDAPLAACLALGITADALREAAEAAGVSVAEEIYAALAE